MEWRREEEGGSLGAFLKQKAVASRLQVSQGRGGWGGGRKWKSAKVKKKKGQRNVTRKSFYGIILPTKGTFCIFST